jgi:uncharacterized protein (DUF58 family)
MATSGPARAAAARLAGLAARLGLHVGGRMGARPGERRFPGRPQATGLEVESHSPYAPGDDLRHLDWNLLGRLDTLLMRRFTAEREVVLHLLVDASGSMGLLAPDRKWGLVSELALALGAVAIASRHAVRLVVLREPAGWHAGALHRRRAGLLAMADQLDATAPGGPLDLGDLLGRYAHRHPEGGAVLVLSDFLVEPERLEPGLAALRQHGYAVYLLQVLGRSDVEPGRVLASGALVDTESGGTHPIALTADVLARYAELLATHQDGLRAVAGRQRAVWTSCTSDASAEDVVTTELARAGLVRARR